MINKHFTLISLVISIFILWIATLLYPGGSQSDLNSIGFSWQHNYICNLFGDTAMNGQENKSKYLAIVGMFVLCLSFANFYFQISQKITHKISSNIVKYCGVVSMILAFFVVTPFHNLALNISNTLSLISMFYIIIFIYSTKGHLCLKVLSILMMAIAYATMFIYYSGYLIEYLPVMQKLSYTFIVSWMLGVNYFWKNTLS